MSRRVDTELINRRRNEREQLVQNGKFIEQIEEEGRTPEKLKEDAREILGLEEDGIIRLEYVAELTKQNLQTSAFIALVNFTSNAKDAKLLTEDELSAIVAIEAKVAQVVATRYDVDVEDLYTEGE